ncbi:MAG: hypothetical protein NTY48_05875 [Candidatus Diapherotrites archaeon]|nr:hypothetical protein [Candidatus Diapherotrites archaeon]
MKKDILSLINFSEVSKFILKYKWLCIFFIPFLFIQMYTVSFLPWDSIPYLFQGKWFCGEQTYLELIRPPVPGFFNCIFGAQLFSIVVSAAFASIIYFIAIFLLFKKEEHLLDQFILGLFAFLFPPLLFFSNFGSDLFAVAFLLLALAVRSPVKKGFLFGLSSLSRYNFAIFGVVFLWELRKTPKKIPLFLAGVVITWIPWMVFNYAYSGDPFFSLNETFYLNVILKGSTAALGIEHYLIFALLAVSVVILGLKKLFSDSLNQVAILNAVQFVLSAVKETRFINFLTPAIGFNLAKICNKRKKTRLIVLVLFVLIFILVLWPFFMNPIGYHDFVFRKDNVPTDSFLFNCKVASDKWVLLYPRGIVAQFLPESSRYQEYLNKGTVLVVYNYKDLNLGVYSSVYNRGDYVIIMPGTCAPPLKRYISGAWNYKVFSWIRDHNYWVSDLRDWPE